MFIIFCKGLDNNFKESVHLTFSDSQSKKWNVPYCNYLNLCLLKNDWVIPVFQEKNWLFSIPEKGYYNIEKQLLTI